MRVTYEHKDLKWVDLESPTREEVKTIMQEFRISPMVAEELLLPATKARIEFHDGFLYLVLHFPAHSHKDHRHEQEIDFIIGHNFVITTRYDHIDSLHQFSKVFEVNSILDKSEIGNSAGLVFFYMMKRLYKMVEHEVEHTRLDMIEIENRIFLGEEKQMVKALSKSGRTLLNLRQTIEPHREVLQRLENEGPRFFGPDFTPYLRALSNDYYRVHNHIMRNTESLRELRETNNGLLSTKQNETIQMLTVLTFIFSPLALLAAVFQASQHAPFVGNAYDFWIITLLMVLAAFFLAFYFKKRNWF